MKDEKIIIGHKEKANFPDLKLRNIKVKIDTGAFTSSIHCHSVIEKDDLLICKLLDPSHKAYTGKEVTFNTYSKKKVKSSNGIIQDRYKVCTNIEFMGKTYPIDLTLTNRKKMKYPVLIGRKFINHKFIVDVSTKYNSTPRI